MADIMRMVDLLAETHAVSRYADNCTISKKCCRELMEMGILKSGSPHAGGTLMLVSVRDGKVEGFFYGVLDRVYHIMDQLAAKDAFLVMSPKADKRDLPKLFDAYIAWAMDNPKVVEINASWTDVTDGSDRIAKLYERRGFVQSGAIYALMPDRQSEEMAA